MSNSGISIPIAQLIREKRVAAGLSHEMLAVAAGLNRSTISLIESQTNNPTINTLERISRALGVKLSDLIAGLIPTLAQ